MSERNRETHLETHLNEVVSEALTQKHLDMKVAQALLDDVGSDCPPPSIEVSKRGPFPSYPCDPPIDDSGGATTALEAPWISPAQIYSLIKHSSDLIPRPDLEIDTELRQTKPNQTIRVKFYDPETSPAVEIDIESAHGISQLSFDRNGNPVKTPDFVTRSKQRLNLFEKGLATWIGSG